VLRVVIVYAVAVLAVLQAADVLAPALHLPSWSVTMVAYLGLLGLPVVIALAWLFDFTPDGVRRTTEASAPAAAPVSNTRMSGYVGVGFLIALVGFGAYSRFGPRGGGGASAGWSSIAVLPFADLSPQKDQEYFSDGIAEEILDALAKLPNLSVASRTSSFAYKGQQKDVRAIANELGVETVLEGSVRKDGNRVRITAQLIDAIKGDHLWSDTFDRELTDIFALQEEIARSIVGALNPGKSGASQPVIKRYTDNLAAYELYLKGRFEQDQILGTGAVPAALRSLERFNEAIALDSTYALAYAGIAETYAWQLADNYWAPREAYPKARVAAERAIALDPELSDAHAALAMVKHWGDWDFAAAEREYKRAIELSPKNARAHYLLGRVLTAQNRLAEAVEHMKEAHRIDRAIGGSRYYGHLFRAQIAQGERSALLDSLRAAVRADSTAVEPLAALSYALHYARRFSELVPVLERYRRLEPRRQTYERVIDAVTYANADRKADAERILAEMKAEQRSTYVSPDEIAQILAALGRKEEACVELQRAVDLGSGNLANTELNNPGFDSIRNDPRFIAIRKLVGLPN
jgi:adenylate cyclase